MHAIQHYNIITIYEEVVKKNSLVYGLRYNSGPNMSRLRIRYSDEHCSLID